MVSVVVLLEANLLVWEPPQTMTTLMICSMDWAVATQIKLTPLQQLIKKKRRHRKNGNKSNQPPLT